MSPGKAHYIHRLGQSYIFAIEQGERVVVPANCRAGIDPGSAAGPTAHIGWIEETLAQDAGELGKDKRTRSGIEQLQRKNHSHHTFDQPQETTAQVPLTEEQLRA